MLLGGKPQEDIWGRQEQFEGQGSRDKSQASSSSSDGQSRILSHTLPGNIVMDVLWHL